MIWHPMSLLGLESDEIKIVQAKGDFLITDRGEKIIDAIASWWTCIHGHNHPKIMEAIRKQTYSLDHVIFAGFTNEPAEQLAEKVLSKTNHDFKAVFFSDNGSNAIEIAVKLAVQFFKNRNISRDKDRKTWIRFSKSYHGDSIGAMSLGGESVFTRIFRDLNFPTKEFDTPDCINCPWNKTPNNCKVECLDELELYINHHPFEVVGAVVEPLVSGANGMIFQHPKFLQKLRLLTKQFGVFLILDEVFTGFFRTGEWFAYQKAHILPDMICLAKGLTGGTLPLALTLIREEIVKEFESKDPAKAFFHGHTMSGNPIACSAALASLEILEKEGLKNIQELELKFEIAKRKLEKKFPDQLRSIRFMGGIFAMEVNQDLGPDEYLNPIGRKLRSQALKQGVLIRPLGNTLYLTTPYNIQDENLNQVFSVIESILEKEFTQKE
jgi:adenosylmethionine-8-amino-7-oxononanoate aminotransferase